MSVELSETFSSSGHEPTPKPDHSTVNIGDIIEQADKVEKTGEKKKPCINITEVKCSKHYMYFGVYAVFVQGKGFDGGYSRHLKYVKQRIGDSYDTYRRAVEEIMPKVKDYYDSYALEEQGSYVKRLIFDGRSLIDLFVGNANGFETLGYPPHNPIFSDTKIINKIRGDLLRLENQIPMPLLQELFKLQSQSRHDLHELALEFFYPLVSTKKTRFNVSSFNDQYDHERYKGSLHCLDLFRRSIIPLEEIKRHRSKACTSSEQIQHRIHCVTDLLETGIKFRSRKTDVLCDIQFKRGVLEIPPLFVNDSTYGLFSSLIKYERFYPDCGNHVTAYMTFMDHLIDSAADVRHLRECGIIEHQLGTDAEAAKRFNYFSNVVKYPIEESYLSDLTKNINRHYSSRLNAWLASLKNKYFDGPWTTISVVAAGILLVMTFVQTFYTVYPYYRPGS